ncbi:MAG TPA: ComEC/Rec2 family competence protein, partial [Candidatus Saccharimonadales bacterium]|nr:ComEC/Rec2 family competence protein [Candidatus Saccharimonadales bacterium]
IAGGAALASIRRHNFVTLVCLVVLSFGVGWWRGAAMMVQLAGYQTYKLQKVTIIGQATDDAVYGERSQLTFGLGNLRVVQPAATALPGTIKVAGFGANAIYRGDTVRVTGRLYPTRGNNQASISFAKLAVLQTGNSSIDNLRRRFAAGLQSALPEPQASLGLGLLIGQRSTLPPDVSVTLLTVGLTHIIAVSGYNLTIIVDSVRRLAGKRSKYQTMAACVVLIALFLLITGSSPSIVRASIISLLGLTAWYYGRTIKPLVLLLTAGAISVCINPMYLWGNVSWYLSFLAFFGVLVVAPLVTERLYGKRKPKLIGQIVIESSCAQIMTVPYVLFIFGHISLVALLANVLVVALIPIAMLLCVVAGLAGAIMPAIAGWFAWPAKWLLTYMVDVAGLLARIPHAALQDLYISFGYMLVCYGLCASVVYIVWRRYGAAVPLDRMSGL